MLNLELLENAILDPSIPSIEQEGKFFLFQEAYIKAKKDKDLEAFQYCLDALDTSFNYLTYLFDNDLYHKNLLLLTLIKVLKADNKPEAPIQWKLQVIKEHYAFSGITFKDDLIFAFIQHVNKQHDLLPKYYLHKGALLFFIAKELKSFLFKLLRKVLYTYKRNAGYEDLREPFISYEDSHDFHPLMVAEDSLLSATLYLLSNQKHNLFKEEQKWLLQSTKQSSN